MVLPEFVWIIEHMRYARRHSVREAAHAVRVNIIGVRHANDGHAGILVSNPRDRVRLFSTATSMHTPEPQNVGLPIARRDHLST